MSNDATQLNLTATVERWTAELKVPGSNFLGISFNILFITIIEYFYNYQNFIREAN